MLNSQENRAGIVKSTRNLLQTYLQSSNSLKSSSQHGFTNSQSKIQDFDESFKV